MATRSSEIVETGSREQTVTRIPLPPPAMNPNDLTSSEKTVSQFFSESGALKPKVLWTLSKIYGHCSCNSNENIVKIFPAVSGQVAPKFTRASRRTSYLCVFGTAE